MKFINQLFKLLSIVIAEIYYLILNNKVYNLHQKSKFNEAIPLAQKTLQLSEKIWDDVCPHTDNILNNLTELYRSSGNAEKAHTVFSGIFQDIHSNIATSLNNLAELYVSQGRYGEAEPLHLQSLKLRQQLFGEIHRDVAMSLSCIAHLYSLQGRYSEAEPLYLQSLELYKQIFGEINRHFVAILQNLAYFYYEQGRYSEAEPLYLQSLKLVKEIFGDVHPDLATSLNNLAALYKSQGRYNEAEPLYLQSLELRKKILVKIHPDIGASLNNLAELYVSQGKYNEAEPLYELSLELYKQIYGEIHPAFALSLNNLAALYNSQGKYSEAETLYQQSLQLRKQIHGEIHPDVATSLNNLAVLYNSQGKYSEVEPLLQQSLQLRKQIFGEIHPDVATSLNNLAVLYNSQGKYSEAETLYQQSLQLRKQIFGEVHPDVATSLNNLALFYYVQGKYNEAELLYQRSLKLSEQIYGKIHPDVATSLNNLAVLYNSQGKYSEVEPLLQQSLQLRKQIFGEIHPDVATSLNNLAVLYNSQGKYSEVEPLLQQSLQLRKQIFGEVHPDVATSLNNLAEVYSSQGKYNEAEPLFQQSLHLFKQIYGEVHPDVATSLNNLSEVYSSQGKYNEAEPLFQQSLHLFKQIYGEVHPHFATSLNNLAKLYNSQGKYNEAEPLFQQSLHLFKQIYGEVHPHFAITLNNLSLFYGATNRPQQALERFKEATEVEHRLMSQEFVGSSENDRMRFLEKIRNTQDYLLSLVYQHYYPLETSEEKSNAIHIALDVVLKRKALSNAASAAISAAIYSNRYPENIQAAFQQWRSLWQQIVNLQSSLYLHENLPRLEANKNLLNDLHQQVEKLEKDITREVPEIRLENQLVDRETIALELPDNSNLIEFVYFPVYDFVNREWKNPRYVAFILPANQPNQVQMFDLGEADKIDELISKVREGVTKLKLEDMPISVGNFNPQVTKPENPQRELSLENLLIELSNTIFKPLENHLQGEQLFICPDNAVTLIPFDILPLNTEKNQLLIDKYHITYLTAARDLLRYQYNPNRPASESLVIADPNFDLSVDSSPTIPNNDNSSKSKIYIKEEGLSINLDSLATEIIESLDNLHDYRFSPVPEIAEIAKIAANQFNVEALLQNQALKSYLTNGKCPEILVLATHGFFLTQKFVPKNLLETQEFGERGLRRSQQMQITENPLFRSGFALAGANTWLLGGEIPPEAGEGIVFAQDVAGFDLWANKIILLIACQTAVGDVTAGEGVKGLRSAFTAAGARLLIMSLWSVPVKPSILLMNRFFENMDNRKLPAQIALKEAQNYIRTMTRNDLESLAIGKEILQELQLKIEPILQQNPELAKTWKMSEYPLQHPYFWGAWVCVGRELKEEENQQLLAS